MRSGDRLAHQVMGELALAPKRRRTVTRAHRHMASIAALSIGASLAAPNFAHAQADTYFDRSNNTSVTERPRPEYAPLGIREGAFLISPELIVMPTYDDNIFATTADTHGDFITGVTPRISVRSNWSRNALSAFAQSTSNIYASNSNETTTDYSIGGAGRLDIYTGYNLNGSLSYSHNTESRSQENAVTNSRTPVQFDTVSASGGATQTLNRLQFNEIVSFTHVDYQNTVAFNGQPLLQNYRNADFINLTGRVSYALSPDVSVFVSGGYNDRPFDLTPVQPLLNRDSTGFETTVGSTFDITRLIRGSVEVGYLEQDYTSALFRAVTGPSFHANVSYFFSDLTTFNLTADRRIIDASDPVASSLLSSEIMLRVDHELLRNVILSANTQFTEGSYKGIQRTDDRTSFAVSGTYLVNRNFSWSASYSFLNQDSSGIARVQNYQVNVVSLSLIFQL